MAAPTVFGATKEGQPVYQWELSNGPLSIKVIDFGATITSVLAPDANGMPRDHYMASFDGVMLPGWRGCWR